MKKRYYSVLSLIVGFMLVGAFALALAGCGDAEGGPGGGGGGDGGGGGNGMGNPNTDGATSAAAIDLTLDEWLTGTVSPTGEQWFRYIPPENGFFSIHVNLGTLGGMVLERYNNSLVNSPSGSRVFSKNDANPILLETTGTVTGGEARYIKVSPDETYGASGGTYQIAVTSGLYSHLRPGEKCPPATYTVVTSEGAWIQGTSASAGQIQWFRYERPAGQARHIHARSMGSPTTAYMRVYYMDGEVAKEANDMTHDTLTENYHWIQALNPGTTFYIRVWGMGAGTYRLAVTTGTQPPEL